MINLPTNWDGVNYLMFKELMELNSNQDSYTDYNRELIAILSNADNYDDIDDLDISEMMRLIKSVEFIKSMPITLHHQIGPFTLKKTQEITLGEYIDLAYYIGEDYIINMTRICALLFRKNKLDEWGNKILEPVDSIDLEERANEFNEYSISQLYPPIKYFTDFTAMISEIHSELLAPSFDEEINTENLPPEMIEDILAEEKKEKENAKWSWENVLYKLSDGDITKYEAILKLPVLFIYNQLAFRKTYNL